MIFSQLSLGAIALLTSLQGVVAAPSPEAVGAVATEHKYDVLDIIPVGDLNITLYGIPDEQPEAAPALHKRCGSNARHCDPTWKNLARDDHCLALINSFRDPKFSNNVIPNGLRSMCSGKGSGTCCVAFTHNLSGTKTRYSDLVGSAFTIYSQCSRMQFNGFSWLSGWTTDTLLGGQCGNQCLSAGSFC